MLEGLLDHGIGYAFAGAFAGLTSGVLGIGGGIIIVPALAYIFSHTPSIATELTMHLAAGTSLAVMVFTAQASVRARMKKEPVLWSVYFSLLPGLIIGTASGVVFASYIRTETLSIIFALFLIAIAFKMLFSKPNDHSHWHPPRWLDALFSFVVGFKSGLLGVGGGILIIPYLTYCGYELRKVSTITALCTIAVALIGTISFIITGRLDTELPSYATGYVYWPAVFLIVIPSMLFAKVGAHVAYRLPLHHLRMAFIIILLMVAVDMLL